MNIEQQHLDHIQADKYIRTQLAVNDWGTSPLEEAVAKSAAEVTKKVAIDFVLWLNYANEEEVPEIEQLDPTLNDEDMAKELFEIYLKIN